MDVITKARDRRQHTAILTDRKAKLIRPRNQMRPNASGSSRPPPPGFGTRERADGTTLMPRLERHKRTKKRKGAFPTVSKSHLTVITAVLATCLGIRPSEQREQFQQWETGSRNPATPIAENSVQARFATAVVQLRRRGPEEPGLGALAATRWCGSTADGSE